MESIARLAIIAAGAAMLFWGTNEHKHENAREHLYHRLAGILGISLISLGVGGLLLYPIFAKGGIYDN